MSANEWMPSSTPIGTLVHGRASSGPRLVVGERLLDEHQPRLAGLLDVACARRPASARNWRRRRAAFSAAPRAPRCAMAISLASGFTPILSLKKSNPSLLSRVGLRDVLLGGLVAEQPHRLHGLAPRAGRRDRSAAGPVARPTRSSTAISSAECAPPLPSSARCNAGRSAGQSWAPCRSAWAPDGRAPRRPALRACRRSSSARTPPRPSRPCRRRPRCGPAGSAPPRWSRRHLHRRLQRQRDRDGIHAADDQRTRCCRTCALGRDDRSVLSSMRPPGADPRLRELIAKSRTAGNV